jgi:hypothetical protein
MLTWIGYQDEQQWGEPRRAGRRGWLGIFRQRRSGDDPFEALEVQMALTRLDQEIKELRRNGRDDFAGAHHLRAAVKAYDYVLDEACRLAGVAAPGGSTYPLGPAAGIQRMLAEAELQARGWDW